MASESALRRRAKKLDWRIEKSRQRTLHSNNKGLFQLINDSNTVVAGGDYDADLDDLEHWISLEEKRRA
jgi:hypothetical protein